MKKAVLLILVFLAFPVFTQEADYGEFDSDYNLAARGKYLTVKIAVAGPGDELYFWFGHIGLVVEDALTGDTRFFDWGVFSFDTENFFLDFAMGRLLYSCMVSPESYAVSHIVNMNRGLTLYTLDLPPEAKTELLLFAENNVRPENRNYWYHHFNDNCATRVRDIIDRAAGGSLKAQYGEMPGRLTLRQHVNRHTWFAPIRGWALSFWMGQGIDRPITVWEEMFLPSEMEEMFLPSEIAMRCKDFSYTDPSGERRQLVSNVEVVSKAVGRPGVKEAPRAGYTAELIIGLCLAAALGFLRWRTLTVNAVGKKGRGETKNIIEQRILGCAQAVLGLCYGFMGSLLFFLTFFTNHDYTYNNANLLFVNPLLLAAVPLGLTLAFGRKEKRQKAGRLLSWLWTVVFAGGLLSIVIRFFPAYYQQNQSTQALVIPFALVLSVLPQLCIKIFRQYVHK